MNVYSLRLVMLKQSENMIALAHSAAKIFFPAIDAFEVAHGASA